MKRLNKKGFTLVELLAVIVVLAVIMIFAVPAVLGAMNNARDTAFIQYTQRVRNAAEQQFRSEDMLQDFSVPEITVTGTGVPTLRTARCYTLNQIGLTSVGSYQGRVIVTHRVADGEEHLIMFVSLTDGRRSVTNMRGEHLNRNLTAWESYNMFDATVLNTVNCEGTTFAVWSGPATAIN